MKSDVGNLLLLYLHFRLAPPLIKVDFAVCKEKLSFFFIIVHKCVDVDLMTLINAID